VTTPRQRILRVKPFDFEGDSSGIFSHNYSFRPHLNVQLSDVELMLEGHADFDADSSICLVRKPGMKEPHVRKLVHRIAPGLSLQPFGDLRLQDRARSRFTGQPSGYQPVIFSIALLRSG
jgi:hypothetical protein